MTFNRMAVPALSLFLGATGFCMAQASGQSQAAPRLTAYAQDRGSWDAPPQELQDIQRQGFRDGIEGARKDFDNHRQPDVNNRDEYRDPRLPRDRREAYREGFRRGYERGVSHLTGGNQEPVGQTEQQMRQRNQRMLGPDQQMRGPDQQMRDGDQGGGPYMGQGMGNEIQRRGFQDGMQGARKDLDNHRQPNVNNRDEYRHPSVPRGLRDDYREAFRRGYDRGMSQQMDEHDRH
jgi:ribosome modulation factor